MPTCKFCDSAPASVKAHVIPESFFVRHGHDAKLVDTLSGTYAKKSPIGVYDKEILCSDCETKFGPYDEYGYKFFHAETANEVIFEGTKGEAQLIRGFDYRLLNLFVLGVLWRASISNHPFYAGVALGPYEEQVKSYLWSDVPSDPDVFPMVLFRFEYPPELVPILCPVRVALQKLNFYQLLLNGYLVSVKVDNRPLPNSLREVHVKTSGPIVVLPRTYKGSPEHRIMVSGVQTTPNLTKQ